MKLEYPFYFYIITNKNKTVLYCGVTNNLRERMNEHYNEQGKKRTFAGRYNCYYLIYYEGYQFIQEAINREKQVKGYTRLNKELLIHTLNPNWEFIQIESE